MDIRAALNEYDAMLGKKPIGEVETFLNGKIAQARTERDFDALFALLNEYVGLSRNLRKREECLAACDELLLLADQIRILNSPQHATMQLNVATAYSVFGKYEGAEALFEDTEQIFAEVEEKNPYTLASLYNNWSTLYLYQNRFEDSVRLQKKVLETVDRYDDLVAEQATSRANIASALVRQYEKEHKKDLLDEAETVLNEALALFSKDTSGSFHYGTALITTGDLLMDRRDYGAAAEAYKAAMDKLDATLGRGRQYQTAKALYERAKAQAEEEA